MSRPPERLSFAVVSLGLLLIAGAAGLQVAVLRTVGQGEEAGDRVVFATYALQGLVAAGAFMFALGVIIGLWGVYASPPGD